MKTKFYFLLLSFCILFLNCTIQGLTNDYSKLDSEQKNLISTIENFEELENGKIYLINAEKLKSEIKNHSKALVYVFTNGCTTKYCFPMNVYINYAEMNGYKLFLVMNGFANLGQTLTQNVETPYFAIDNEFYSVSNRSKYSKYFENELMDLPKETFHKNYLGNLFFFEKGKFVTVNKELPKY